MYRYLIITILLLLNSSLALGKPILNIQHWTTQNGARVLFVETHELPMIDIQISFDAGSSRDHNYPGIAYFTNAMLDEGTETLTADEIANIFNSSGAQVGSYVNKDMGILHLRSLTNPTQLNPAIETFTKILTSPSFPQTAFKRVQKQILTAIDEEKQYPENIAYNTFYKTLYRNFSYNHPIIGEKEVIQTLTQKHLEIFYKNYYVANNVTISIVGDFNLKQAKEIINRIILKLPKGQLPDKLPPVPQLKQAEIKNINFPSKQTHILIGQIGINWHTKDYFPLLIGNYILGQPSSLTSILFKEIRNKRGLAYSVDSEFNMLKANGPFVIALQTKTEQTQQAIKVTKELLKKFISVGPSKQQLIDAKKSLIGRFSLSLASNSQILNYLSIIGFYNLPMDYLDIYEEKINEVSLKQIKKALKNHMQPDKMAIITVGERNLVF